MPLPLNLAWSNNGTAKKTGQKLISGFKIAPTTFVIASFIIVLFVCCLSPIGANATDAEAENEGTVILQEAGHARHRRAAVTPLGKRLTTKLVAELGTRPRHLYSFGIGKFLFEALITTNEKFKICFIYMK